MDGIYSLINSLVDNIFQKKKKDEEDKQQIFQESSFQNNEEDRKKNQQILDSIIASGQPLRNDIGQMQNTNAPKNAQMANGMVDNTWQALAQRDQMTNGATPPLNSSAENKAAILWNQPDLNPDDEMSQDIQVRKMQRWEEQNPGRNLPTQPLDPMQNPNQTASATTTPEVNKLVDSLAAGIADIKKGVESKAADVAKAATEYLNPVGPSGLATDLKKVTSAIGDTKLIDLPFAPAGASDLQKKTGAPTPTIRDTMNFISGLDQNGNADPNIPPVLGGGLDMAAANTVDDAMKLAGPLVRQGAGAAAKYAEDVARGIQTMPGGFEAGAIKLGGYGEQALKAAQENIPLVNKFKYTPATNLSPEDAQIETKFGNYIGDNLDKVVSEYKSKFGKILNTDNARELSQDYAQSNQTRSTLSKAVHEPASALVKQIFNQELAKPDPTGENIILFTAGGTGSGKTTAVENKIPEIWDSAQMIYDTNMNNLKSSEEKIQQVLDAGKRAVISYVYTPAEDAFGRAINRAKRIGRTVPMEAHVDTHAGSLETVKQLAEKYKNDPNVDFLVFDNSGEKGKVKETGLDFLNNIVYNRDGLKQTLERRLENEYQTNSLPDEIYRGFKGQNPTEGNIPAYSAGDGQKPQLGLPEQTLNQDLPLVAGQDGPPYLNNKNLPKPEYPFGQKERKFIETVRESPATNPEVAADVKGSYTPKGNEATLARAKAMVENNLDEAITYAKTEGVPDADRTAVQQVLMGKYQNEGNFNAAVDMAEEAARQATSQGQAIQALSMWGRLTPEGALTYAQRQIQKVNQGRAASKAIKLSEEDAGKITELAKAANAAPEGREKAVAAAKLMDAIAEKLPNTPGNVISSIQTLSQLLNPKTAIRNIIGNLGFAGIENVKDVVATPIDMATSLVTGQRTKTFPDLITQGKGAYNGFKAGLTDALQGIDTSGGVNSQFEISKKTFRDPILGNLEKLLNIELKAPDRAFYQAAYDDSLRQAMKLAKVEEPTGEMLARAHYDGLYRTFQDDNAASIGFKMLKDGLNKLSSPIFGNDWGAGDAVLKYPKTPGSILARAIEYSPVGFIKTATKLAEPLFGKPFNQKEFVESTARVLTGGAGLIGTGAILHKLGVISGTSEDDFDIQNTQKAAGLAGYQLNASALKRLVASGFNAEAAKPQEGDTMVTFDWFQPQAIDLAMGADFDKHNGDKKSLLGAIADTMTSGANTLVEQPLLTGLNKAFAYGDPIKGFMEAAKGIPASMVPTILNQVRQLTDNVARNPQNPDYGTEALNMVKNKIPLVAGELPPRVNVWGDLQQNYQDGSNNWFNVFLNPSFTTQLKETPEGKEVLDIYNQSGETQQAPRLVQNKIEINGQQKELTGAEIAKMQNYVGVKTKEKFAEAMREPGFMELSPTEKAKTLSNIMTDIHQAAKIELFGHQPKKVSKKVYRIIDEPNPELPLVAQ